MVWMTGRMKSLEEIALQLNLSRERVRRAVGAETTASSFKESGSIGVFSGERNEKAIAHKPSACCVGFDTLWDFPAGAISLTIRRAARTGAY